MALEPALAAIRAAIEDPSTATGPSRQAIDAHVRLLLAWNTAMNLTAITDPGAVARLHVADSLSALPVILAGPHASLLDLGSGGGFPGLPLAAALPRTRVGLLESVGKKATFLEAAVRAAGLADRVTVLARRAEAAAPGRWDIVTARAVGALPDLVELALPLLGPGGRLVAWKRAMPGAELAAAGRASAALGGSVPSFNLLPARIATAAGLEGHGLAVVTKLRPTPAMFPRDPAARKRTPW